MKREVCVVFCPYCNAQFEVEEVPPFVVECPDCGAELTDADIVECYEEER